MTVGEHIQKERTKQGMTLEALSVKSGITRTGLMKIIKGQVKKPQPKTIKALIEAFGLDFETTYSEWVEEE